MSDENKGNPAIPADLPMPAVKAPEGTAEVGQALPGNFEVLLNAMAKMRADLDASNKRRAELEMRVMALTAQSTAKDHSGVEVTRVHCNVCGEDAVDGLCPRGHTDKINHVGIGRLDDGRTTMVIVRQQ